MMIAFRVDASPRMGIGHLQRCLSLAHGLRRRGADILVVTRESGIGSASMVEAAGFSTVRLPAVDDTQPFDIPAGSPRHATWAGVPLALDADQTLAALACFRPDWLVIDHYAIHAPWQTRLRSRVRSIMVIDDLADRQHDCDVLLDQNLPPVAARYDGLVPPHCTVLAGPMFALLRPEFAQLRTTLAPRVGPVHRVLVFMGGGDMRNVTGRVLEALLTAHTPELTVDVVLSQGSPHEQSVRKMCATTPGFTLHLQTPDMAGLRARSDLMIGASGSTTWERCCVGLPALLFSIADNQRGVGGEAARRRFALYLGDDTSVTQERLHSVLHRLLGRPALLRRLGLRALRVTDGRGAERVTAVLSDGPDPTTPFKGESQINSHLPLLAD